MPSLCEKCAIHPDIIFVIKSFGAEVLRCEICGAEATLALDCEAPPLRHIFRALIRYYFSEWDYNSHMGGDELPELLSRTNPLTAYDDAWNDDAYQVALDQLLDGAYQPYESGISLYSGYSEEGIPLMPLIALSRDKHSSLNRLEQKLRRMNYFLLESEARALLEPHVNILRRHVEMGSVLHRARIGYRNKATPLFGMREHWHFQPYEATALSAPPPPSAGPGRLNRPGVSYLYLATEVETAISEVRPHPGHHVSVGAFRSEKSLMIADFSLITIRDFCDSDERLEQFLLLKNIDQLLSLPIVPEEREKYSFTQFLADVLRHLGFDGIGFMSSVGSGSNVVVFDPENFSFVAGSARVVRVNSLRYSHSALANMLEDVDYMTDPNGNYY